MTDNRITTPTRLESRDTQRVVRDLVDRYRKRIFEDGDTTPSVATPTALRETFHFANTSSTVVTGFDDAHEGQEFVVVFDGMTNLQASATLVLNTSTVTEFSASTIIPAGVRFAHALQALTLTLPDPATLLEGREMNIKNLSTGTVTIMPNSGEDIDGSSSNISLTVQYESVTLYTDQVDWFVK